MSDAPSLGVEMPPAGRRPGPAADVPVPPNGTRPSSVPVRSPAEHPHAEQTVTCRPVS
ncbi:hypothetical protein [Actinomadura opuntiae]|uniref:hypothetical protein n=1 Tax=Actinomadura sp. OS1-43 TaxID=604315 RepID=UPI00255AC03C|nr:hypothetical protein [Actinomadura sp. OS1-43]MDL4814283.1 hypothetical protein [Actinomadura sp. OS1-43]